ncbi:MAG: hypothetical protein K0S65_1666 [Labilithrix sp.]|nr:hypothetical protein [Labilithrix sp.]
MLHARLLSVCALVLVAFVASCDSETGDPHSPSAVPPPAGKDRRIHEIRDPASPTKATHESQVQVSGAVVVAVDKFDETRNGKSAGTIYVSDLGSKEPFSGISLYNPSFIPGNLRVGAGDALDLRGEYQENQDIPIKFAPGAFLVQLANPIGTFRFDAQVPEPVEIKLEELANYETGRKWLNMLVTVKDVTVQGEPFGSGGRRSYNILPETSSGQVDCEGPFPKVPTLVNELTDLEPLQLTEGTVIKSLTGVVTFFCNLHIAPRDAKDIVL